MFGSTSSRWPTWEVRIWNPNEVTINQVATDTPPSAGMDISAYVTSVNYTENIGFENGDDPSVTQAGFKFRRNPVNGLDIRRGWIEDGVIVRVSQGDIRVARSEWVPIFTGTFRGRPGDNPGVPADLSEGLEANAYGREERYLNRMVTTENFPVDTDVGVIAVTIAQRHMNLTQDEILLGAQGFTTKHLTNQIVELNALQALWELLFTVNRKPKFDARGRLVAVDVNLDKPAARVWSDNDVLLKSKVAAPNDVEVANRVVIRGLDAKLTKIVQEIQLLATVSPTTGFFDSNFDKRVYYSEDRTQRAQETFLKTIDRIQWSEAEWAEVDEFHGRLSIDTHFLRNARLIIFITYLVTKLVVALIDLFFQGGDVLVTLFTIFGVAITLATLRFILETLSQIALAALLWAMNFIGRGEYEIHGRPFEFVYQELVSQSKLVDIAEEDLRTVEFRNDLLSDMATLDVRSRDQLRRELVKNQLFVIVVMDDPLLEVDDIVEDKDGNRYYITSVEKTLQRDTAATLKLTTWKVFDATTATIEALEIAAVAS